MLSEVEAGSPYANADPSRWYSRPVLSEVEAGSPNVNTDASRWKSRPVLSKVEAGVALTPK